MKSDSYNVADIDRIVNACAASDAVARQYIRTADYRAFISTNGVMVDATEPLEHGKKANSCLLVQAWPGGDALTFVHYKLLGAKVASRPSITSEFEFAIAWSAEVGIKQADPIIVHVVQGDDAPVYFDYAVSHHLGRKRDHFSLDVQDLNDRYSQMVERVCEHVMLVTQFHAQIDLNPQVAA
ncbi:hypothetical protein [Pacificoceanicola onchidii]|uniref:hypothetical protein n=1 Tax=Pacificoceanicola onchidii TaxID=2562685 RepID=UPI0010A4E25D|nr:hypothetical protein [Pacificoceanicola onchidii]